MRKTEAEIERSLAPLTSGLSEGEEGQDSAAACACFEGNVSGALERLSDLQGLVREEAQKETEEIRDGLLLRQALALIRARLECRLWHQHRAPKGSAV